MNGLIKSILIPFVGALVICFLLIPASAEFARAFPALFLAEVIFARDFSKHFLALERAHGTALPYRKRLPFLPIAAGLLTYAAIGFEVLPTAAAITMGLVAAISIAAGKLWLSTGPLWPYQAQSGPGESRAGDC